MESLSLAEKPPSRSSEDSDSGRRPPPAPDERLAAPLSSSGERCAGPPQFLTSQPERQASAVASDRVSPCAVGENAQPDGQLLRDIGAAISGREHCAFLALNLKIGEDEILRVATTKLTDTLAYEVLKKWKEVHCECATGAMLHAAFCDMGWQVLASQFEDRLFGRDVSTAGSATGQARETPADLEPTASGLDSSAVVDASPQNDQLLRDIGAAISSHEQCIGLAVKLKVGDDEFFKVVEAPFTSELAYNIFKSWKKVHGGRATGSVLHAALCDIERQDLAERFQSRLSGKGFSSVRIVEEYSELAAGELDEAASGNEMTVSIDLLHQIAAYLPKLKHCVRLAENLGLGEDFVGRVRAGTFSPDSASLCVLCKWRQRRSKQATGRVLFDALIAIRRRDIAAGFAEDLLGNAIDDWEDFCYDGKHCDFFRLLRGWHIDVVASFESMHCSEDFLSCLNRSKILTHPEYKKLLDSSRTLLRNDMNKKLMDIINEKPPQLQEMFADQLCRYQPQLVVVEEVEASAALSESSQREVNEAFGNAPWELQWQGLLLDFKEELRRFFNQLLIVRPFDLIASEDIQPVSELYITLSTISYEEALKLIGGPQQIRGSQLLKAASQADAESKHSRELLDLHSLLRSPQGKQAKSAVLFGSAGTGKTLTTLKILSEWNNADTISPFKEFDVIVYITGREHTRLRAKDMGALWQLQRMGFTEQQERFILDHFACHSDRVLFLIDGWDEGGDDGLLHEGSILKQILRTSQSSVIITSRPASNAYPLLEECKCHYSLVGFNDRRLQELFKRHLEQPLASRLFKTLSQPSNLHMKAAIQKTPLFATMLVELYKMEETLPVTITALYQLMLDSMRCRYVQRVREVEAGGRGRMMMYDEKPAKADFDKAKTKLSKLALAGLMSNKVTFSHDEAMSCSEVVIKSRFGLLSEVKDIGLRGSRVLYHFNHLTWQEYLAAYSLANDPDFIQKLQTCISSIGVGQHTRIFWRFLVGLVSRCLLPDVIFELAKAGGVSGVAPWETEFRLFLIDCVAECIRMSQVCGEQVSTDIYVQLAAEMITHSSSDIMLSGCTLDTNQLMSLAVMLGACPCIKSVSILNCRVDHKCPPLTGALNHIVSLEFGQISGQAAVSVVQMFVNVLDSSDMISVATCHSIPLSAECMLALAQLTNNSYTLTELCFSDCDIGSAGLACFSRSIHHSSSLEKLHFENDRLTGAGGLLGQICARLSHLEILEAVKCCLDNDDLAGILAGLQNSSRLEILQVAKNQLSDDFAVPLVQYAVYRNQLAQQVLPFHEGRLPQLHVVVGADSISDELLFHLAEILPEQCNITILNSHLIVSHRTVAERDNVEDILRVVTEATDGHVDYAHPEMGDRGAVQMAQFLSTDYARSIRSLDLNDSDIEDGGVVAIASALPHSNLQGLDLSSNRLTFVGFYKLMSAVSMGRSLQYLNVGHNPIFASAGSLDNQMSPSILTLSLSIHSLRILGVSSTNYSDKFGSFQNSALALMTIPRLSALDLSNNDITDKSITMVTEWMAKLEYLSLSGNRISSAGGRVLIQKAESLGEENAEVQKQSAVCLQWIWLGRNNIEESIFAECSNKIISNESLSLIAMSPRHVLDMFSSATIGNSSVGQNVRSPFWTRVKAIVGTNIFDDFMETVRQERDRVCFDRWLVRAVHALARHESDDPAGEARSLINLFAQFSNWYNANEANTPMVLASLSCMICIVDELIITRGMFELEPQAERFTQQITRLSMRESDFLCRTTQFMSGVAERCRQRQLHSVADRLVQQMEHVSQQAWIAMLSSVW